MDMQAILRRIERRLNETGLSEAATSRKATGSPDTIRNWRRRAQQGVDFGVSTATLQAVADVLQVTPAWLTGEVARRPGQVPLKGYIGAGGEVFAEEFGGDETVEAPAEAAPETVAARVRGTSMYPTFQDGWLIYWSKQLAPDALMNTIVVAQLEDNRIMVKTIMPGSKPGLWNLVSVNPNTPPMIDQVVRWVAPIDWIRPR